MVADDFLSVGTNRLSLDAPLPQPFGQRRLLFLGALAGQGSTHLALGGTGPSRPTGDPLGLTGPRELGWGRMKKHTGEKGKTEAQ